MALLNSQNIDVKTENTETNCHGHYSYNQIAEHKLQSLQTEYEEVIKANNTVPVDSDSDSNSDNHDNDLAYLPVNCNPSEDEFVEVIEDNESDANVKCNHNNNESKRKSVSPVKHKERVINAMKRIKITPPKWAENLTDEEFMKGAKRLLEMRRNKKM